MITRCTSEGHSPMRRTRSSRYQRSSGTPLVQWMLVDKPAGALRLGLHRGRARRTRE